MGIVADLLQDAGSFERALLEEDLFTLEMFLGVVRNAVDQKKGLPVSQADAATGLAELEATVAEDRKFGTAASAVPTEEQLRDALRARREAGKDERG